MTTQWVIDEVKVEERWRSRKVAGKYQNFVPPPQAGFGMVLQRFGKWMCAPNRDPQKPLPIEPLTRELLLGADSLSLWKIGHSTVLFKVADKFYITDPVFSERASPFTWLGPKRFTPPAIALTELPPLEGIILSHDHYDHLDVPSLKVLAPTTKYFVCPLGQEEVLTTQVGVEASRIVSLDWWQRATFDRTVSFTCVPGQHFTARTLSDRFDRLWCSWAIEFKEPAFKLFFMGDSGFNEEMHRAIGEVCGPFDVCLMENGQYSDAWCFAHSHPEETVREFELLRGRWLIPIHNCTFTLAFHAWHEPLERVYHLCAERNLNLCTPKFGERVDLKNVQPLARWWRPIMATERGEENIKLPTNEDPIRPANELKQ